MKVFKYTLEALLLLRENSTQKAMLEYGKYVQQKDALDREYNFIKREVERLEGELVKSKNEIFSAGDRVIHTKFIGQKKIKLQQVAIRQDQVKSELKEAYHKFLKAKKDEDILLKHREKKREEYRNEALLEEEKFLQDLTNSRKGKENR